MVKQQSKTKNLLVVADLGASNPKFIVSFQKNQLDYFILDSRMEKVPASLVNKYREEEEWLGDERLASEDAFLQIADESNYWVFGTLSHYFDPEQRLDKSLKKYELGALRILCSLGILVHQRGIKYRNFNLDLCVLLPADEIGDQQRFLNYFEQIAQKWWFRGEVFSCHLRKTKIEREGAASLRYLLGKQQYKDEYKNKDIGLVMAGYRNVSFFVLRNGKAEVQESPIQGFHKCIENICRNNAAIQPAELNRALANAYYSMLPYELAKVPKEVYDQFFKVYRELPERSPSPSTLNSRIKSKQQELQQGKIFNYRLLDNSKDQHGSWIFKVRREGKFPEFKDCKEIKKLIKTGNQHLAEQELNDLVNEITKELNAYGEQFQNFLKRYFKEIDQLIVMGGASIFLYYWISSFCNRYDVLEIKERGLKASLPYETATYTSEQEGEVIQIDSLPKLREELVKDFGLDTKDKDYSSIPLRFLDCYCFYQLCLNQIKKEEKEQRKQEKAKQVSEEGH